MVYSFDDKKSVKILKGATRNRKSKDTQHNGQKNKEKKGQKMIYKTLHIKINRVTRTTLTPGVNSDAPEV
jgi:hypothetical protein